MTVTVAESMSESRSVITTIGLTVIGCPVVPAAAAATNTTGTICTSGNPTTVTTVAACTTLGLPSTSVTEKLTDFNPAAAEVRVTDCSSC
ncbi:hypothetical protein [Mycolicibacterium gilvum]|uniref:hypothetical protein n=1 Tax=Mycolicibacterium gilvum TaxID=1804 RepID=UPI0021F3108D|nr:hypothetical protein [Mycolicibacterium gilvum]MCV7055341.1 hypothetical protein [Mycolicibacterium gilvum]